MGTIVRIVLDICLLKKGPQNLPYSQLLFYLSLLVYSVVSLVLLLLLSTNLVMAILQLTVEILLMYGFSWGMLYLTKRSTRFYQTATALFATDTLITICAIPVFWAMLTQQTSPVFDLLRLILMLWHWLVTGHIFRHALSTSFALGLCLALLYIISAYQLMVLLFAGT